MVHESLESGGSIAESKEHDSGLKESHGGDKRSLPLIFLPVLQSSSEDAGTPTFFLEPLVIPETILRTLKGLSTNLPF